MASTIEQRVKALESEVSELKKRLEQPASPEPWWMQISGTFRGDPEFLKAMELGRKWRESTRGKPKAKKKRSHGNP